MKKKRLIKGIVMGGISGLLGIFILTGVFAGCGPRRYHSSFRGSTMDVDRISKKMADRLDLTEEQRIQLKKMVSEVRAKREEGSDWKKSAKQDVINLIRQERIGQADIDRLVETHRQRMDALIAFLGDRFIRFHASLNSEQREKLVAEIEKHDSHHCRHRW